MRKLLLASALVVLFALISVARMQDAAAVGRVAQIEADLLSEYPQGASGLVTLRVVFDDPEAGLERGVLFLNVVELDASRNWPQAAHRIFASASETPPTFRRALSAEALRAGVETTISFRLRPAAAPGDYALVIALFEGDVTNPNAVKVEHRLLMRGFDFRVLGR